MTEPQSDDLPELAYAPDLGIVLRRTEGDSYVVDPTPVDPAWQTHLEHAGYPKEPMRPLDDVKTGDQVRVIPLAMPAESFGTETYTSGNPYGPGGGIGGGGSGGGGGGAGGIAGGIAIGAAGNAIYDGAKHIYRWVRKHT